MSGNLHNLFCPQVRFLKEPADGFMSQVMEPEVNDPGTTFLPNRLARTSAAGLLVIYMLTGTVTRC